MGATQSMDSSYNAHFEQTRPSYLTAATRLSHNGTSDLGDQ